MAIPKIIDRERNPSINSATIPISSSISSGETLNTLFIKSKNTIIDSSKWNGITKSQVNDLINKISLTINDNTFTLTNTDTDTKITSGSITFPSYITKSNLSTEGSCTINASNITTGKLAWDRIDSSSLKIEKVYSVASNKCFIDCSYAGEVYIGGINSNNQANEINIRGSSIVMANLGTNGAILNIDLGSPVRIYSSQNTSYLGTLDHPWTNSYISNLYVRIGTTTYLSGATSGSNYVLTPSNCSLGTSSSSFTNGYFTTLYAGGKTISSSTIGTSASPFANGYFTTLYAGGKSITSTSVGTSASPFTNGYFTNLYINGTSVSATPKVSSITSGTSYKVTLSNYNLLPSNNNNYNLGSGSYYWAALYTYAIYLKYNNYTVKLTCYNQNELSIGGKKATHA